MSRELPLTDAAVEAATLTGQLALYELRVGDVLAGRFRIEGMLGVGGMGVVYRAHDESLGVDVAIKLLRPELARRPEAFERFRQELLLARQVSSPHVVRIHDIAEDNGRWFISMDYIDGESLERRLDALGRLSVEETLAITRDLLEGLAAAQARGVVHRDLKPANILIDRAGRAYITDFGVARSLGTTGVTHSGVIVGTPEYLSPEQARGETVDARSDLYAVGLILYEMLAGALPFRAGTPAETVIQRIVRPPPPLARHRADLPRWLYAFVDRLLKLHPGQRFASAADALRALETRRVPRAPLARRTVLLAILALVLVLGAADWFSRWRAERGVASPAAPPPVPRLALLPIRADPAQAPLARALEEHLAAWLRTDAGIGVIPRRRVLHALARVAPDARDEALDRLLPAVADAANATHWLAGSLRGADTGVTLQLTWHAAAGAAPTTLTLHGRDGAALYAAYLAEVPGFLAAAGVRAGPPPSLAATELVDYGAALGDLDAGRYAEAMRKLAPLSATGVLVAAAQLEAATRAEQPMQAQERRVAIVQRFAAETSPTALELRARALAENGDDGAATRLLSEAVRAWPHDAALRVAAADALRAHGDGATALAWLKDYVGTAADDARAWFLLGRIAIEQGDASAAVENYLLHAQTLNVLARDAAAEAETRNAIGIGYERLGQLDAAAEQYQRAAAIREKQDDRAGLARTLRNLAIVQAEQGRRTEAAQTLARAGSLLEALGDRASIADLYNDRGVVAEEAGDFAEALGFYRQAYALRQQLDDPAPIAESLNNIGYCFYRMGDFDNAAAYWNQALAQYRKLDDRSRALNIGENLALLDIARGRFAAAAQALEAARGDAEAHQLPDEAAVANVSLAELALLEGRYRDAAAAAEQAARIFTRRGDARGQTEAALLEARLALALGDAATAATRLDAVERAPRNAEQDAEYRLASAALAALRDDAAARAANLDAAAAAAAKAHGGALALRVELERVRLALATGDRARAAKLLAAVRQQGTRLNDVPLRLAWLELEIAGALRNGNAAAAIARYHEALPLLRTAGRSANAGLLHRLGELALAGNRAEAEAARAAAAAARTRLLDDAPAASRASLEAALARRWREETGRDDGG